MPIKSCSTKIHKVFLKIRETKNLTQTELGDLIGLTGGQIGRIERGEATPRKRTLLTLVANKLASEEDVYEQQLSRATIETGRIIENLERHHQALINTMFIEIHECLKVRKPGEKVNFIVMSRGKKLECEF